MAKKYIIERHHMGFTTRVTEQLPKHEAEQIAHDLNEANTDGAKYVVKAVRRG